MNLQLLIPTEILVSRKVSKLIAEAENGFFCLLPRHIDFVAALVPGIFSFTTESDEEHFYAIKQGVLVKCGPTVKVSTYSAVHSRSLETLQNTVESEFLMLNEHEKSARNALSRLEVGTIRRFMQFRDKKIV